MKNLTIYLFVLSLASLYPPPRSLVPLLCPLLDEILQSFLVVFYTTLRVLRPQVARTPHTCTALRSLAPPARAGVVQCRCRRHEPSILPPRQRWICHSQPPPFTLPNSVINSHYGKLFSISLLSVVRLLFCITVLLLLWDIDTIPF